MQRIAESQIRKKLFLLVIMTIIFQGLMKCQALC